MTAPLFSTPRKREIASSRQALLGVSAFVTLWAIIEIVAAAVFRRVTPLQTVFVRYSVHLLITLALWGRHAPWRTRMLKLQLLRSAMMLVMPVAYIIGVERGHAPAWIMTIFWCAPLLVVLFAVLFTGERASPTIWLAAAIGWVAAWLYFAPVGRPSLGTVVFGLAMAASFAAYIPMTRALSHEPLSTNLFYTAVVPWIALLPVMPKVWVAPAPAGIAGLLFIGAAGWVTLLAIDRGSEAAPVVDTAPLLHLQVGVTMVITVAEGHSPGFARVLPTAALVAAALLLSGIRLRTRQTVELA